jgi:exo-beta-1,3-glucanase (GH17 family)
MKKIWLLMLLAFLLWPILCLAAGFNPQYLGVGYQPYHTPGKGWGDYTQAEVEADMLLIARNFKIIRTWTVQYSNIYTVPAAAKYNVGVHLGLWIFPGNDAATKAEIDKGIQLAGQHPNTVKALIVGNECLGNVSEADIISYMEYARKGLKRAGINLPVSTCQTWGVWAGHASLADHVDQFIYANIYPFWDKAAIGKAINQFLSDYNALKKAIPAKTIIVGETGWPSQGPANGQAMPGISQERQYFQQYSQWASANKVTSFIFEMFDEPWKGEPYEAHFGLYTTNSQPKFSLSSGAPPATNALLWD